MLRAIISPARKMSSGCDDFAAWDVPCRPAYTEQILKALAELEASDLQKLWGVSDRLFATAYPLLQQLVHVGIPHSLNGIPPRHASLFSPALFSYQGIQYTHMAPAVMSDDDLAWIADHLRIISALHGCVRPFDAIMPYRLEMAHKLHVGSYKTLYKFWGTAIADDVCVGLDTTEVPAVINLASVEYAQAVLPYIPSQIKVYTCIFCEELRHGKPIQRSTAAKAARGSMIRWMAENKIESPQELQHFDVGYRLSTELSNTNTLVFLNKKLSL